MFGPRSAATTYAKVDLESRVNSANQHQLIQMLYDDAILSVAQAVSALERNDIAAKGAAISRAISIIEDGLRASLDPTQGGALAASLDGLYEYMSQRLLLASLRNDPALFSEVKQLLNELREAWASIANAATQPKPELAAVAGGRNR